MPRADVVLNPISGPSVGPRALAGFRLTLEAAGWDVRLRPTERAGHAPELARAAAAEGADVVVAAGGDGTINEVATGLLAAGPGAPPLGILPLGTSNLVARDLGVPLDARRAATVIVRRTTRMLDVADVTPASGPRRRMLACAGAGWDAAVVAALSRERRGHITPWTWLGPIRRTIRDYAFPVVRVTPAGGRPREAILALFLNCRPYARFFDPAPAARPDDGLLDAVLVGPAGRGRLGRLAWLAWRGRMAEDAAVEVVRAASFELTSDAPVPLQADGDAAGATPAAIAVRPAALRVVAPSTARATG